MFDCKIVGIDLAKSSFQIHESSKSGKVLGRHKKNRQQLHDYIRQMPNNTTVFMEACASANYWGRVIQSHGHVAKLIAPQYVKPFVKRQKNDAHDAEAICEAGSRENMRFVGVKSVAQQDMQILHRIRSRHVANRTALYNQMRAILLEYGIAVPKGMSHVRTIIVAVLSDSKAIERSDLSQCMKHELKDLLDEARVLDEKIDGFELKLKAFIEGDDRCKGLMDIPGIGPITATALVSTLGNCNEFKNSRQVAAYLGLVPRQESTGGKTKLLGISKQGDKYLRTLLIHGARAVLMNTGKKTDPRSLWAEKLKAKVGMNKAAVAMANKNARTVFAILQKGKSYDPNHKSVPPIQNKKSSPLAISSSPNYAAPAH